jgi:hypothetical protein
MPVALDPLDPQHMRVNIIPYAGAKDGINAGHWITV